MENPKMRCHNCWGRGRICYNDGTSTTCGLCHGEKRVALNGTQIASSPRCIHLWLQLTGNELRLRAKGKTWEAQVFNQGRIGLGEGDTMQEALAKAFDTAIEFMNDEYLERVTSAPIRV